MLAPQLLILRRPQGFQAPGPSQIEKLPVDRLGIAVLGIEGAAGRTSFADPTAAASPSSP